MGRPRGRPGPLGEPLFQGRFDLCDRVFPVVITHTFLHDGFECEGLYGLLHFSIGDAKFLRNIACREQIFLICCHVILHENMCGECELNLVLQEPLRSVRHTEHQNASGVI